MTPDPGLREAAEIKWNRTQLEHFAKRHDEDIAAGIHPPDGITFALANFAASLLDAEIASGEWLNAQGIGQTFDCEGGICWQEESGDICINFVEDSDYIRLLKNPTRGAVRALQLALSPKEDGNG